MTLRRSNGSILFTSHVRSKLFHIDGPLVKELILEFFSTFEFEDTHAELDRAHNLTF